MNKKNILTAVISLIVLSFVMVQCTKENTNEVKNSERTELILRSNTSIGGQVISPNCDIYDELPAVECYTGHTDTIEITSPNGCQIEVIMFVQNCFDHANDQTWIVFSDLEWHLATPISNECLDWYWGIRVLEAGKQNKLLDELESYLESEFEKLYMINEVVTHNLSCKWSHSSALYFKSPCTQRCGPSPAENGGGSFFYSTPCAEDGCCYNQTDYCLKPDGTVYIGETYTSQIAACTNFISVKCSNGTIPVGDCVDKGCE